MKRRLRLSPVFAKEMVQTATSRQSAVLRIVYLAILSAVCYFAIARNHGHRVDIGGSVFKFLSIVQLSAAFILTPIVTAGTIAGERQANTLSLLFMTQMSHRNVIQDKSLSRIVYMAKFCMLAMPYMFLSVMLGGVEWSQIILVEVIIVSTILVVGSFCTYQSVVRRNYLLSLTSCYLYLFLYFIISGAVGGILGYVASGEIGVLGFLLNPALQLVQISKGYGGEGVSDMLQVVILYALGTAGLYFMFLQAACSRLAILRNNDLLGPGDESSVQNEEEALKWKNLKNRHIKLPPIRLVPNHTCESFLACGMRNLRGFVRSYPKTTCICVIVAVAAIRQLGRSFFASHVLYLALYVIGGIILFFLTVVRSATAFSAERQSDRLDLLLSTPVTGRRFVLQALVSIMKPLLPFWIGWILVLRIGNGVIQYDLYWSGAGIALMGGSIYLAAYMLFMISLGMTISIRCRNNARAAGLMMAIVVIHWIAPLLLSALSEKEKYHLLSPVQWFTLIMDAGRFRKESGIVDERYIGQVALYVSLAGILFGYLYWGFDRIVKRQRSGQVIANSSQNASSELP